MKGVEVQRKILLHNCLHQGETGRCAGVVGVSQRVVGQGRTANGHIGICSSHGLCCGCVESVIICGTAFEGGVGVAGRVVSQTATTTPRKSVTPCCPALTGHPLHFVAVSALVNVNDLGREFEAACPTDSMRHT